MLLRKLKSNNALNLFFIPVVVLAFWAKDLMHPVVDNYSLCEKNTILFAPIAKLLCNNPRAQIIISAILVMALSFLMQLINDRYTFIRIRSKLPSVLYAILLGGFVSMHTLHPVYFGAIFILFAINRLFTMFEQVKAYSAAFDVGFLLGIASLFCFNLIVLYPAFLIGTAVLSRKSQLREFIILTMGLVLSYLFAFSYAFLNDTLPEMWQTLTGNFSTSVNSFEGDPNLTIYLVVLIVFTVMASFDLLKQYDNKKISSRKYFTAFFCIFIFTLMGYVFLPTASYQILVVAAVPVAFLISNFFVFMKSRFWSEFLFALLLLSMIAMHFI